MIRELDCVYLLVDLPELGLRRGDLGAVVHIHAGEGSEVEFVAPAGGTPTVVTLRSDAISPVPSDSPSAVYSAVGVIRQEVGAKPHRGPAISD